MYFQSRRVQAIKKQAQRAVEVHSAPPNGPENVPRVTISYPNVAGTLTEPNATFPHLFTTNTLFRERKGKKGRVVEFESPGVVKLIKREEMVQAIASIRSVQ